MYLFVFVSQLSRRPPIEINNRSICDHPHPCFELKVPLDKTVLQTYNCDRQRGQKSEKMPAEKQLYRPDYVKQHFVHYSTVTNLTLMNREETAAFGQPWKRKLRQILFPDLEMS